MKPCERSFKSENTSDDHIKETLTLKSMFVSAPGFSLYHNFYFKFSA